MSQRLRRFVHLSYPSLFMIDTSGARCFPRKGSLTGDLDAKLPTKRQAYFCGMAKRFSSTFLFPLCYVVWEYNVSLKLLLHCFFKLRAIPGSC